MSAVLAAAQRLLRPLSTRIANMVARATVARVNDGKKLQLLQLDVLDGETREGCEHFQPYGFTAHPKAGAEAAVVFVGGRRDHGLVVAVSDRRYRLVGLEEGEVALYTDEGDSIRLCRGGIVRISSAHVELGGGTMQPVALATSLRTELDALWTALQTHVHPGVTAGGAATGAPAVTKVAQTIASASVQART